MAKIPDRIQMTITINTKIKLWDAIKLRIAGVAALNDYLMSKITGEGETFLEVEDQS